MTMVLSVLAGFPMHAFFTDPLLRFSLDGARQSSQPVFFRDPMKHSLTHTQIHPDTVKQTCAGRESNSKPPALEAHALTPTSRSLSNIRLLYLYEYPFY